MNLPTPIGILLPGNAQEVNDVQLLYTDIMLCKFAEFMLPFELESFVFPSFV
jgi:hypothetical protein